MPTFFFNCNCFYISLSLPASPPSLPRSLLLSLPRPPQLFPSFIPAAFSHLTHSIYSFDLPNPPPSHPLLYSSPIVGTFLHFLRLARCKCDANVDFCFYCVSAPLYPHWPSALLSSARLLSIVSPPPQTGRRTGRRRQSSFQHHIRLNLQCVTLKEPLPR